MKRIVLFLKRMVEKTGKIVDFNLAKALKLAFYGKSTKNALSSLNILTYGIILIAVVFIIKDSPYLGFSLIILWVVMKYGLALYFAIKDPDRLQDENHLQQMKQIDLGSKAEQEKLTKNNSIEKIANNQTEDESI